MTDRHGLTLWRFYQEQAAKITNQSFRSISSRTDWEAQQPVLRHQFMRSVGLDPLPPRCAPAVTDYGEFRGEGYRARKIAYQILLDCWATATVYYPDPQPDASLPAVLYACGHAANGILHYQPHGIMWARRGYVCLVFDTIEQHDNPGDHHGLCYHNRYDWLSLGYSAAGGELLNSLRALDVLAALPEVDVERIGATGISGGGAHSLFVGIADTRIKAVASSCGATVQLHGIRDRHLMDHCDCMYAHNPYHCDASEFAALMAPRPLLYCFATQDSLFSLEETRGLAERTRRVYRLYDREDNCELFEYPGPHQYQPESVKTVNAWFDRHVAGQERPALGLQEPEHTEQTLTIFNGQQPVGNRLAELPELITPVGRVALPRGPEDWAAIREETVETLRREVFALLEEDNEEIELQLLGDWLLGETRFLRYSGALGGMDVWLELRIPPGNPGKVILGCANMDECARDVMNRLATNAGENILVAVEPRGTGFTACHPRQQRSVLRAGALVGLTPVTLIMRDIQQILAWLRRLPEIGDKPVALFGRGDAAVACLYHAVLHADIAGVVAEELPDTHRQGGYILGILRVLDIEHAIGLMAPRPVALINTGISQRMFWGSRAYDRLGCPEKLIDWNLSLQVALRHVLTQQEASGEETMALR